MFIKYMRLAATLSAVLFIACSVSVGSGNNNANAVNTTAVNSNSPANDSTPVTSATPAAKPDTNDAAAAEKLVSDLYKAHDGKHSPFFQTKNRRLVDKYFTKQLADLIWKDAVSSKDEVGAIDGDPLYNAQDMEIKNFAIGKASIKDDSATVPVTFTNFGDKQKVDFLLKLVNGSWRIDDIEYGKGDSLMKWLKDTYPDKPTN